MITRLMRRRTKSQPCVFKVTLDLQVQLVPPVPQAQQVLQALQVLPELLAPQVQLELLAPQEQPAPRVLQVLLAP